MLIQQYFVDLQHHLQRFPSLTSTALTFEDRTPHIGLFKGLLTFYDGSSLAVTEFVDVEEGVQAIKYKYHFTRAGRLIFRYGNARDPHARGLPTFPHHKHTAAGLVASAQPTLEHVLDEIYRDMLWPPNHKLILVSIVGVSDPDNDQVTMTVTGVTQDEAINGLGDGDTSPDAVVQHGQLALRAERAGTGNGRVYRVSFTATDGRAIGGSCSGSVTVCVPHNQKTTCVDDGQGFPSF